MTISILPLPVLLAHLRATPCAPEWARVVALWPEGIPVGPAALALALAEEFDLLWVSRHLREPALGAFTAAIAPALAEYERDTRGASRDLRAADYTVEARVEAIGVYRRALAKYTEAVGPALIQALTVRDTL